MAGSCRVHVTWDMFTGLSEIINHYERSSPLLVACTYTKLQTWWRGQCSRCLNSLAHTLLHSHCSNSVTFFTVVILVFWLYQFNTGSLPLGCVCHQQRSVFFRCSKVMVGDICRLSFIGCHLFLFKNGRLGQGSCYLSVPPFFCPPFWCVSLAFEVH